MRARTIRALVVFSFVVIAIASAASVASAQEQPQQTPSVTFSKDVAPILQRSCQVCHHPDAIAPMSLLTYQEVRPWARSIKAKVTAREMPPWYIDPHVGIRRFKNDRSLTDEEIAKLVAWVDQGAPQGNPADMPAPRQFEDTDKWHIGQPDLIVTLPKDVIVAANAPDRWMDVLVDSGLTEDRYLKAVETKPTKGFRVVHHSVQTMRTEDQSEADATFLNEYALGKNGDVFPDGAGRLIKAGTKINFNLHLHAIGQAQPANVQVGLKFYPKGYVPVFVETTNPVGNSGERDLDLPPNTDNVRTDGFMTLTKPIRLLSYQPHMHNRGKAMCVEAIYPPPPPVATDAAASINQPSGGLPNRNETLSCVDRYQFAWHIVYLYDEDVQPLLPAGTILHVIGYHNNTTSNKFNPDPDNLITFGQRTVDDMNFAWMSWYTLTDEQYKQMVQERKAKTKKLTN